MKQLVIIQDSRKTEGDILVMVDRKFKNGFWSDVSVNKAKIFFSEIDAKKALEKLKFNNPRIITLEEAKELLTKQNSVPVNSKDILKNKYFDLGGLNQPDTYSNRLEYKTNHEWHDDDWYEGCND
jgi:hypothetical protein